VSLAEHHVAVVNKTSETAASSDRISPAALERKSVQRESGAQSGAADYESNQFGGACKKTGAKTTPPPARPQAPAPQPQH